MQVLVSLKSPLIAMAVGVSGSLPVFVIVMVCALLGVPSSWLAKVKEAGVAVAVVVTG
jgi:hypothetical protein